MSLCKTCEIKEFVKETLQTASQKKGIQFQVNYDEEHLLQIEYKGNRFNESRINVANIERWISGIDDLTPKIRVLNNEKDLKVIPKERSRIIFFCSKKQKQKECESLYQSLNTVLTDVDESSKSSNIKKTIGGINNIDFYFSEYSKKALRGLKSQIRKDVFLAQLDQAIYKDKEDNTIEDPKKIQEQLDLLNLEYPLIANSMRLLKNAVDLQNMVGDLEEHSPHVLTVVAIEGTSPSNNYRKGSQSNSLKSKIDLEFYELSSFKPGKMNKMSGSILRRFTDFFAAKMVYSSGFDPSVLNILKKNGGSALCFLYSTKLNTHKRGLSEYFEMMLDLRKDYMLEKDTSQRFLRHGRDIIVEIDIFKSINHRIVEELDVNFDNIPCFYLVKYNPYFEKLESKKLEIRTIHHIEIKRLINGSREFLELKVEQTLSQKWMYDNFKRGEQFKTSISNISKFLELNDLIGPEYIEIQKFQRASSSFSIIFCSLGDENHPCNKLLRKMKMNSKEEIYYWIDQYPPSFIGHTNITLQWKATRNDHINNEKNENSVFELIPFH